MENFGGQWLHLRNVADWMPDPERFADFDDSLRYAFERETALFLDHLVREDRSVLELLDADYTFPQRAAGRLLRHSTGSTAATSAGSRWPAPHAAAS